MKAIRYLPDLPEATRNALNTFRAECEYFVNQTEDFIDPNVLEAMLSTLVTEAQRLIRQVKVSPGYEKEAMDA